MIHTSKSARCVSVFFAPLLQNRLLIAAYLILFPIFNGLHTFSWMQTQARYQMPWCTADQLCYTTVPSFFVLSAVVPFLYLINHMVKHSFSIPVVIRQRSKVGLWFHQLLQTAAASAALTLYILLCVIVAGKVMGLDLLNWSSPISAYYAFTQTVNTQITIGYIVLIFSISCFLGLLTAGTLFLLLRWATDQYLPGWIVILVLGSVDIVGFSLLFNRLALNHKRWVEPAVIPQNLLIPLLWLMAAAILGIFVARRKDFLRVQQKQTNE